MLHSLITLVVTIIILVLVLGLLQYVLNLFPPPDRLGNVLRVVVRHADRRLAPVRHGSRRTSWSNPQVVGKVAGEEIVAELGDGLGHDVLVTVLLTQDHEPHHPPGYPFRIWRAARSRRRCP